MTCVAMQSTGQTTVFKYHATTSSDEQVVANEKNFGKVYNTKLETNNNIENNAMKKRQNVEYNNYKQNYKSFINRIFLQ